MMEEYNYCDDINWIAYSRSFNRFIFSYYHNMLITIESHIFITPIREIKSGE